MSNRDKVNIFVEDFMSRYNSLINSIGRNYLIPNRYTVEDIKQYIGERIIQILTNRLLSSDNQIENPEKYFKSCITFYCIEYQRMHGYIFELPKRPRKNCELDEEHIKSYGFKYLGDMTNEEYASLIIEDGVEDKKDNVVWDTILSCLSKEEADVIDCIFNKNLTWLETSKFLNVPQSTCWIRKERAIEKLCSAFKKLKGDLGDTLKKIIRGDATVLGDLGQN